MNLGNIDNAYTNLDFEEIPYTINLSGVTWENRQAEIAKLNADEKLLLERDYTNEHDKNAIAVKNQQGTQIGWVPKRHSEVLASEIDAGINWNAKVEKVIGEGKTNLGVLIKLFIS